MIEKLLENPIINERLKQIQDNGIIFDKYGLIVPSFSKDINNKIATNLSEIKSKIENAIKNGKQILYLPGSYDLIHAGHASYVLQCTEKYLSNNPGLTRKDLFIMLLADDDELIRAVKPYYAMKDPTDHPRPIQNFELFKYKTNIHPRLFDLASLSVNLVGLIPSPTNFADTINNNGFQEWLTNNINIKYKTNEDNWLNEVLDNYYKLLENINKNNFYKILISFQNHKFNPKFEKTNSTWAITIWQLLIHNFLTENIGEGKIIRILSEKDSKYKDQAAKLMNIAKISIENIDDDEIISTTKLIETYGWQILYEAKIKNYLN